VSDLDRIEIDPAALASGAEARLGELHALRLAQRPAEGLAQRHVTEEKLPLDFERVVIGAGVRDFRPPCRSSTVGPHPGSRRRWVASADGSPNMFGQSADATPARPGTRMWTNR